MCPKEAPNSKIPQKCPVVSVSKVPKLNLPSKSFCVCLIKSTEAAIESRPPKAKVPPKVPRKCSQNSSKVRTPKCSYLQTNWTHRVNLFVSGWSRPLRPLSDPGPGVTTVAAVTGDGIIPPWCRWSSYADACPGKKGNEINVRYNLNRTKQVTYHHKIASIN